MDRLELAYWWPGIHYDVETFISKCVRCQELSGQKPQPSSLQSLPICEEPNFRVHMDLFGPLRCRSASGKKYILVVTDAFSKYTELSAISDKSANTVARSFFECWICHHGVPRSIDDAVSTHGRWVVGQGDLWLPCLPYCACVWLLCFFLPGLWCVLLPDAEVAEAGQAFVLSLIHISEPTRPY